MSGSDRKQAFKAFEVVKKATLKICNGAGEIIGTGFAVSADGHFVTCAHVVEDAGGIGKLSANGNVGIIECYKGDPSQDDIALLQVIDYKSPIFLHLADLLEDQNFLCFGFSNETYRDGAPIEGKIVGSATSTDSTLLNQRVLRLVTEGDSQAIKGGQSGAAVCVYNARKKQWQSVGILVASEGMNGGIALPITNTVRQLIPIDPNILRWKIAKIITGIAAISLISCSVLWLSLSKCSDKTLQDSRDRIAALIKTDLSKAIELAEKFEKECPLNTEPLISNGFAILEKGSQGNLKNQTELELARNKFLQVLKREQPENENNGMAKLGLGLTLSKMGDYLEAIKQLETIKDKTNLNIKARLQISLNYIELESFKEAEDSLKFIIQNIQNKGIRWNEINSKQPLFDNYKEALRALIGISGTQWYRNRENDSQKRKYYENYIKHNELYFKEIVFPNDKKLYLDKMVERMDYPKKSDAYAYYTSTEEYKSMICKLYEMYGFEKPERFQTQCRS